MLNKIILQGRLVADPELKRTPSDVAVCTARIAVERDFKDKATGQKQTDFISVVAWRQTGEFLAQYFTKGRMLVLDGALQIREYTDKEGNKRTAAEVVAEHIYFGDSKPSGEGAAPSKAPVTVAFDAPLDDGGLPF